MASGPYKGQSPYGDPTIIPNVPVSLLAGTGTATAGDLIPFPTLAGVKGWGVVDHDVANGDVASLGVNRHFYVRKKTGVGEALAYGAQFTIDAVSGQSYGEAQKTGLSDVVYGTVLTAAGDDDALVHVWLKFDFGGDYYTTPGT